MQKKVSVNISKDWLISIKMLVEAYDINQCLDRITVTNYWLILTSYWLRMTKTKYVEYETVSVNISQILVKHR